MNENHRNSSLLQIRASQSLIFKSILIGMVLIIVSINIRPLEFAKSVLPYLQKEYDNNFNINKKKNYLLVDQINRSKIFHLSLNQSDSKILSIKKEKQISGVENVDQKYCGEWHWEYVSDQGGDPPIEVDKINERFDNFCGATVEVRNLTGKGYGPEGITYVLSFSATNANAEWEPKLHWKENNTFLTPVITSDLQVAPIDKNEEASIELKGVYTQGSINTDAGLLFIKSFIDIIGSATGTSCTVPLEDIAFLGVQFGYSLDSIMEYIITGEIQLQLPEWREVRNLFLHSEVNLFKLIKLFFADDNELLLHEFEQTWEKFIDIWENYLGSTLIDCSTNVYSNAGDANPNILKFYWRAIGTFGTEATDLITKYGQKPVEIRVWYEPFQETIITPTPTVIPAPSSSKVLITFNNEEHEILDIDKDGFIDLDLDSLRPYEGAPLFARWSPNGSELLVGHYTKDGISTFTVADLVTKTFTKVSGKLNVDVGGRFSSFSSYWSPVEQKLAFYGVNPQFPLTPDPVKDNNVKTGLYIVNSDGSNLENFTKGTHIEIRNFIWTPSGSKILFTRFSDYSDGFDDVDLYNFDIYSREYILLEKTIKDIYIEWDSFCKDYAILETNNGNFLYDLKTMTKTNKIKFDLRKLDNNISPDCLYIAYRSSNESGSKESVIIQNLFDSNDVTKIVPEIDVNTKISQVTWLPDGEKLAIVTESDEQVWPDPLGMIYLVRIEDKSTTLLTYPNSNDPIANVISIQWSP